MSTPSDHVDPLVEDYVHDLLPAEQARRVEQHCNTCVSCCQALELARRRLRLLQAVPSVEPSAALVPATLERIQTHEARRRRWRGHLAWGMLASLAASALLLTGLQLYYTLLRPGTIDLIVLGQNQLLAATSAALRVRLVDRQAGMVLSGVPVVVSLLAPDGRSERLAEFTTDMHGGGSPLVRLPDWADGRYELLVSAETPRGSQTLRRPVQLKRSWKLMLSTDKPLYQPGQTILIRSLALRRPDLRPVAGQEAVYSLTDPRGNVLFRHRQPTSPHGITAAECPLDPEIQEGAYTLACKIGDTESRQTVEVRRYVLPKYLIELTPDRSYYAPGQQARVRIQADYFFGKPVGRANLTLAVRVKDAGERQHASVSAVTDERGTAEVTFQMPTALVGQPADGGDARVHLIATLTDSAGQTETRAVERVVSSRSVRLDVLPEAGGLVPGVANTVYLLVRRPDGTAEPKARVQVLGDASAEVQTDEHGAGSLIFTPAGGTARLDLVVHTAAGEVVERTTRLLNAQPGDFLFRTDRAVYRAGETLTASALGGGVEPVFLDVLKDGQTLLSALIEMTDGRGEQAIDLPPDLFGTLQIVAYRFVGPEGLPYRQTRLLYVAAANEIKVQATLDQPEYQPGKQATLHLRLTDGKGKPVPGAVSLAGVDERIFHVLAQRPGMEQTFYHLEQELLRPVYAIYPWMPGDAPDAGRRDQVLFAAAARRQPPAPSTGPARQMAAGEAHTLAARSLPEQEQAVRQLRQKRLGQVRTGWATLALTALAGGYALLWLFFSTRLVLILHGVTGLLLIGMVGGGVRLALLGGGRSVRFNAVGEVLTFALPQSAADKSASPRAGAMPPDVRAPGGAEPPRVRQHFPETLLWKPELITDDQGRLPPLPITLADSITSWRLSASAVTTEGRLGATQLPLKVFQPFFVELNLPTTLTRGDEVGVPVVVYNYLDRPQTVTLTLADAPWFKRSGPAEQKLELAAGEVRSTRYTLQVVRVGSQRLKVTALAGTVGDALEREIEVVPDGRRVETAFSGSLASPAERTLEVPAGAIEGSVKVFVKLYPSGFSQLVEGLDSIFQMPGGCFEQTSSTTYPNILALDYLRRNRLSVPAVEAKARQYIHLGYQRLVGFEVSGGGFDWYGRPPASVALTAYGLMEFSDMARVHDVDPRLIERTRRWLLAQRQPDGSWVGQQGAHLAGGGDEGTARLAMTAYVARAVFSGGLSSEAAQTRTWLLGHRPDDIKDPHALALLCNALLAIDPQMSELPAYLDRLKALRQTTEDDRQAFWSRPAGGRTLFYSRGVSEQVETTALAVQALLQARRHGDVSRAALAWLVARKDARGTWHSTQATVQALKALLAATSASTEGEGDRRFTLTVGEHSRPVVLAADQADVLRQIDLSSHLAAGANQLLLQETTKSATGYQVVFRYHLPAEKQAVQEKEPLAIQIDYDRTSLAVGDVVRARATVINRQAVEAPMVMLDLPVPPGFTADPSAFDRLVNDGRIARYQVRPRTVLVYLRGLAPAQPLLLDYSLRATLPVKAATPAARVYEYYDPQKQGTASSPRFVVTPRD